MDRILQRAITLDKRKTQTCKVFECKVDTSKLSTTSLKHLNKLFIEAKWFYNYCLSKDNVNLSNTTLKEVPVKVKDQFENRKLDTISSQMKQSIKGKIFDNLRTLSSLKKKGNHIGKLKFKSIINTIQLKQFNNTYKINFNKNTIQIQGLKQKLKVKGLSQINPETCEIANAVILRKPSGYYFHITTFKTKEPKTTSNESIGIDFGCESQLTFSNGIKLKYNIPVNTKIK